MIGGIGSYSNMNSLYNPYSISQTRSAQSAAYSNPSSDAATLSLGRSVSSDRTNGVVLNSGASDQVAPGRKSSPAECKTCAERKYQDGSDEMVSFKSPTHISPSASASSVMAHEQEHVSNAYKKASDKNGTVLQATVTLKTAICPECGTSYVAGGETNTSIKYSNEDNPYMQNKKALDAQSLVGANLDYAV